MERLTIANADLLDQANLKIDEALAEAGGIPTSRESAGGWLKVKYRCQTHPDLLALCHDFCDEHGYQRPKHCQIALRFPGERVGEKEKNERWHIDKNRFDRLVGIYLNDNLLPDCGNFVIAPGSERIFPDFLAIEKGMEGTFEELGISPEQVLAGKGTLLSVHRMLCHTTAPNESEDYVRRVVWFRLKRTK